MLSLEQRRRWAIAAGVRLETITAILARRRRCSQVTALVLARLAKRLRIPIDAKTLAMNLYAKNPVFTAPPRKVYA